MARMDYHVVPRSGRWAVTRQNADRASSLHDTQREAIEAGRELAQHSRSELLIHGRDGRIRERDSHGRDPFPPRG